MHFPQIYFYNGIILILNSFIHLHKIKDKVRFFFGFWIFGAGWIMINHGLFYSGIILKHPEFFGLISFGKFISMGGIFLTFYFLFNPDKKFSFPLLLVFSPALFPSIKLYNFFKNSPEYIVNTVINYLKHNKPEDLITEPFWFTNLYMIFLILLIIFYVKNRLDWKIILKFINSNNKIKKTVFILFSLTILECILYTLFVNFSLILPKPLIGIIEISLMINAIVVVMGFQINIFLLKKGIIDLNVEKIEIQKYLKSYLGNLDISKIENKMDLLESGKFYMDPDLTLNRLADKLEITPHQLSEYLNQKCNCSFRKFINSKRFDSCINELLNSPEKTITQIWLDAGFNSSSVFYRVFKEKTGLSPEEYRIKNTFPDIG